jgi:hypothetical protein
MGFKNMRDKAVEKAAQLAANEKFDGVRNTAAKLNQNEKFNEIVDKAVEDVTTPRTNRQHATDAVISVAVTVATGGAALPLAIVFAAAEGGAMKIWTDSDMAKKLAASRKKKSEARKKDKDGPKPQ